MPLAAERENRRRQYLQVEPDGHVLHVEQVVLDPLMKVAVLAVVATDLPETSDPRADGKPRVAPGDAQLVLAKGRWPGADQTHIAAKDIQQLRQFVEIGSPQEATETRHPRVALRTDVQLELGAVH